MPFETIFVLFFLPGNKYQHTVLCRCSFTRVIALHLNMAEPGLLQHH